MVYSLWAFWRHFSGRSLKTFHLSPPGPGVVVMLRWLLAAAPVVALASTPCVKDAVLTQELGGTQVETMGDPADLYSFFS